MVLTGLIAANDAGATDFSAGFVMDSMERPERYTFVSGVIEGLAYARYVKDGKKSEPGMRCIYDWFYEKDGTLERIYQAFDSFRDYTPGAIVAALAEKECGE